MVEPAAERETNVHRRTKDDGGKNGMQASAISWFRFLGSSSVFILDIHIHIDLRIDSDVL